jgi:hypothetical protein
MNDTKDLASDVFWISHIFPGGSNREAVGRSHENDSVVYLAEVRDIVFKKISKLRPDQFIPDFNRPRWDGMSADDQQAAKQAVLRSRYLAELASTGVHEVGHQVLAGETRLPYTYIPRATRANPPPRPRTDWWHHPAKVEPLSARPRCPTRL